MKGLGANRSRHLSDSCEPTGGVGGVGGGGGGPQKSLCSLASSSSSDPHRGGSFLLSPAANHYATLDPRLHHHHHYAPGSPPTPLPPPDCLLPFGQVSNSSSTFPRLHFTSQADQVDCPQSCVGSGQIGVAGTLPTSVSMGMHGLGLGLQGLSGAGMITSGSATISSAQAAKMNRLPSGLLDHLERHLPLQRDGFSTLQFHRGRVSKQRSESPGRIRHLMHSVQKLFAKSQSLETGNANGRTAGVGGGGTAGGGEDGGGGGGGRPTGRSKSKDRGAVKSEGPKQQRAQCRPNALALWNSDDTLDTDTAKAGTIAVGYRNPLSMMTLGRAVSDSQAPPRLLPQGYHTISASHSHMLKTSKSSGDLKFLACQATQVGSKEDECRIRSGKKDPLVKRGSWSSMTLSQARQVLQKGSATVNRTLLKSKSCHQDLACNYLQVPLGEWSGTLGRGGGRPGAGGGGGGGGTEIPCRRMRSGSYVKAMGDLEDSEDSEGSPKPSPKSAARRQSYLKATQRSLSEQHPPPPPPPRKPRRYDRPPRCYGRPRVYALMREDFLWSPLQGTCSVQHLSSLPSLKELNTNRSLDNLDCLVSPVDPHPPPRHWDSDFSQGFGTLGRGVGSQVCGQSCGRSLASMPVLYCQGTGSQAVEALDLPAPTCFRSRSHSYLRAIQAGCSQDDDTASLSSDSPPPSATGHLYCSIGSRNKAPPPVPPRCSASSKPLISVTVQSSTESAQDTYLEHRHDNNNNSQSGDSNTSSDSLCSIRTGSLAKGPAHRQAPPLLAPAPTSVPAPTAPAATVAAAPVPAPREAPPTTTSSSSSIVTSSSVVTTSTCTTSLTTSTSTSTSTSTQPQNDTLSLAPVLEKSPVAEPKRKLSSIGIQVDCFVPISREEPLPLAAPLKFQSIGVQVENGRPLSRVSSMASRQNTETDPQETPDDAPPPPPETNCSDARQTPNGEKDGSTISPPTTPTTATTATEAPRVPCASQQEPLDPALDPSSLPPPDPSLGTGNCVGGPGDCGNNSSSSSGTSSATPTCFRDGNCFLKLLQAETARMEGWCQQMEAETKDNQLSEEVLGTIRSAVGSAQLLMAKKFQQFRGLCNENLKVDANPRPTAQDLAGFWDLLQLTIEDISMKFDELYQLKANNWQLPEKPEKKEKKALPSSVPKKSPRPKLSAGSKERSSVDSTAADKQRQEARKRLMAAKRAASVRQNSATESADSIEIYVPEAQTRL